jgi:hypothetical protein
MRKSTWKDVPGSICFEYCYDSGRLFALDGDSETDRLRESGLETWMNRHGIPDEGEVVVNFVSTGYYDPGVRSGPVERCYPPEGGDEREPAGAVIEVNGKHVANLPEEIEGRLFELFENEIYEAELLCWD